MTQLMLGILIGAGIAFIGLAYVEEKERKKEALYEKMKTKLP